MDKVILWSGVTRVFLQPSHDTIKTPTLDSVFGSDGKRILSFTFPQTGGIPPAQWEPVWGSGLNPALNGGLPAPGSE